MNHKPIIQSFLIKTNIRIDIVNLIEHIEISTQSVRSGSILAVKYKDVIKGNASLFKSSVGFKNSCHLLICYIAQMQQKKFIQVKITSRSEEHTSELQSHHELVFRLLLE